MESCLCTTELHYTSIEEHQTRIDTIVKHMMVNNERMVFAIIAERASITPFVIRQYPELRTYLLQRMNYYKEIQVINKKIERAVTNLLKSNKSITFMSIISKCKFSLDTVYHNEYIKNEVRNRVVKAKKKDYLLHPLT